MPSLSCEDLSTDPTLRDVSSTDSILTSEASDRSGTILSTETHSSAENQETISSQATVSNMADGLSAPPRHVPYVRDEVIKDRTSPTLDDILRKASNGKYNGTCLSQAQIVTCELAERLCTLAISLFENRTPKRMTRLVALREEIWGWFAEGFDEWEHFDEDTIDDLNIWLAKTIETLQEEHKEIETALAANQSAGRISHERRRLQRANWRERQSIERREQTSSTERVDRVDR